MPKRRWGGVMADYPNRFTKWGTYRDTYRPERRPGAVEITEVDFTGLDDGLRHYVASLADGYVEVVHQGTGTVLRVKEDTFRERLRRRLNVTVGGLQPESDLALRVLVSLLPMLCLDCGEPMVPCPAHQPVNLCVDCHDRQVADLLRISSGD